MRKRIKSEWKSIIFQCEFYNLYVINTGKKNHYILNPETNYKQIFESLSHTLKKIVYLDFLFSLQTNNNLYEIYLVKINNPLIFLFFIYNK